MKRKEKEVIFLITTWGSSHFLWSVRAGSVPQGELVKPTHLQIGTQIGGTLTTTIKTVDSVLDRKF